MNSLGMRHNLHQSCLCCRNRPNYSSRTAMNDVVKAIRVLFGYYDVTKLDTPCFCEHMYNSYCEDTSLIVGGNNRQTTSQLCMLEKN